MNPVTAVGGLRVGSRWDGRPSHARTGCGGDQAWGRRGEIRGRARVRIGSALGIEGGITGEVVAQIAG